MQTGTEPSPAAKNRRPYGRLAMTIGVAGLVIAAWKFKVTGQPPFLHRENVWSVAMYEGPSPLDLHPTTDRNAPLLTASAVTDIDALFVADPFMVRDGDISYLFVEVLNKATQQGDIGVAISRDQERTWEYQKTVLDEPWHLSYPSVFSWNGRWYMVPQGDSGVHLYEAEAFPQKWRRIATLVDGPDLADPTLFRYDDSWWMFLGRSGSHDRLQLYFADHLEGPWHEHPKSPLIDGNPDVARPGGKIVQYNGSLYRFAQDCAPKYGNQLRAFQITHLDRTDYREASLEGQLVLRRGSHAWNRHGMHHVDAHQRADGSWYAIVDGHKKTWTLSWTP